MLQQPVYCRLYVGRADSFADCRGVPDSQQWRTWAAIRRRGGRGFHPDRNRTAEDIIRHGFP